MLALVRQKAVSYLACCPQTPPRLLGRGSWCSGSRERQTLVVATGTTGRQQRGRGVCKSRTDWGKAVPDGAEEERQVGLSEGGEECGRPRREEAGRMGPGGTLMQWCR